MPQLHFHQVSYRYEAMTRDLFSNLDCSLPGNWTGVVGANGVGKTTLLQLAAGGIKPDSGHIIRPESGIYCSQRTDWAPANLCGLLAATEGRAYKIKGQLAVSEDWHDRWHTLSHGERKRAQIACAIWSETKLLAIDEPTNHLDVEAKLMLTEALKSYRGIGLLVSHDRELLDSLCQQCLFVDSTEVTLRPGNFSTGSEQKKQEYQHQFNERKQAKRRLKNLQREAAIRRDQASRSHQLRSKKGFPIKDHDARFKKNIARFTDKDGQAGSLLNQLSGRVQRASADLQSKQVNKQAHLGISMQGEKARRRKLFSLDHFQLVMGDRNLTLPGLHMNSTDRVAITGLNGSGKSTLVTHIVEGLNLPANRLVYIPQEISLSESRRIIKLARDLPDKQLGQMMTIISRLGSRPSRLLESTQPSPGEVRKLLLAIGISHEPHLIIMDEPTNHLDLPSIECLQSALTECACGILLVSHDKPFLSAVTEINWHISADSNDDYQLQVLDRLTSRV